MWILGDSIPYWAGVHAEKTGKTHLNIQGRTVAWLGVRGLRWGSLRNVIEAKVLFSSAPDIVLVNLGGNDLPYLSLLEIKDSIRREIEYLHDAFPDATLIWMDILQRQRWGDNYQMIERKRQRVNRFARQIIAKSVKRFHFIKPDIDSKTPFFRPDGVHLNLVGLEFYLDYVKDAILRNSGTKD